MSPGRPAFTRACYSIAELQQLLGVGKHSVYSMLKQGKIPNIRVGKKFVVPIAAVTRMLENVGAPPAPAAVEASTGPVAETCQVSPWRDPAQHNADSRRRD
jgi:excisionase family DNA binding protein